jgi:hypothetical protein
MNAERLLATLTARGVELHAAGDRIHYRAPVGVLTDADREALRQCKPELLELLTAPATLPPVPMADELAAIIRVAENWHAPTPEQLAALWEAEGWRRVDLLPCLPPERKQIVGGDEESARGFLIGAEPHRLVLLEGRLKGWAQ